LWYVWLEGGKVVNVVEWQCERSEGEEEDGCDLEGGL
jgi:hypothetical protein